MLSQGHPVQQIGQEMLQSNMSIKEDSSKVKTIVLESGVSGISETADSLSESWCVSGIVVSYYGCQKF